MQPYRKSRSTAEATHRSFGARIRRIVAGSDYVAVKGADLFSFAPGGRCLHGARARLAGRDGLADDAHVLDLRARPRRPATENRVPLLPRRADGHARAWASPPRSSSATSPPPRAPRARRRGCAWSTSWPGRCCSRWVAARLRRPRDPKKEESMVAQMSKVASSPAIAIVGAGRRAREPGCVHPARAEGDLADEPDDRRLRGAVDRLRAGLAPAARDRAHHARRRARLGAAASSAARASGFSATRGRWRR